MATKIDWCDETINPIVGCTKVSRACKHCYAEVMANRLAHIQHSCYKYGPVINEAGKWNGNVVFDYKELKKPEAWSKSKRIFITSMGDLFHEKVKYEWLQMIMLMIHGNPQHTFIICTKRPENMLAFFTSESNPFKEAPLKNLWGGVTVEDQVQVAKRIPFLLQTPLTIRFISYEPAMSAIDISSGRDLNKFNGLPFIDWLDWVIAGGESGPKAEPSHPNWFTSIRDQCISSNVPFFFKGWGEYHTFSSHGSLFDNIPIPYFRMFHTKQHWINKAQTWVRKGKCVSIDGIQCKIGKDFNECQYPVAIMDKVGKKNSGKELDGKEYTQFPKI